jgi:hypothetical protein
MKFQIELTNGAIKNSYINLRGHLDKFLDCQLSCAQTNKQGQTLKLDLGGGHIIETDVCSKYKRFRNRTALNILNMRHDFEIGDKLTIEQCSPEIWKVYKQ